MSKRIVIALGGNALGKTAQEQLRLVTETARPIVDLIEAGNEVVVAHGNGPQVGMINNAFAYAAANDGKTPEMPFPEAGAMSQGYIGYDLQNARALATEALSKGYKEEFILKTGICYKTDRGDLIDRYAGRVIFPWIGISGKVVGFGGRLLDSRTKGVNQKYVNSPDSEIYHKDRELYGIYQAKKAIAKEDRVFMVEGYTDVISMHQCGIENVVANSGTALSVHQIHILHRFTSNITLLYDGDAAGIHAAMRGTDMLLAEGMNLKVLLLPDGDDPDSFARKHSAEDFRKYIEEHQTDFIEFKTDLLLRNERDPLKRSEAINSIIRSIS